MVPFFSLILPAYNVEAYLERCLRSILAQKMTDYEVILVDDGSQDNTSLICDAFAEVYDHIHVIHKENGGLSSARNAGLQRACGQYVWFIDSDDWIESSALTILREACNTGADIVKFGYIRAKGVERKAHPCVLTVGEYVGDSTEMLLNFALLHTSEYQLSVWSHVYRRSFLKKNDMSFVSERIVGSEDYLFNLQALVRADAMLVIGKDLYVYDLRQGSLTQSYKPDLAQRYTALYSCVKESFSQAGKLAQYEALIGRFYVWHLMIGTVMAHEYRRIGLACTAQEAGRKVQAVLKIPEFAEAAKRADRSGLSWPRRLLLYAVPLQMEKLFRYRYTRKFAHLLK